MTTATTATPALPTPTRGISDWITGILGLVWFGGTFLLATRLAFRLIRLAYRSQRLDTIGSGPWFDDARRIAGEFGLLRSVRLVTGEPGSSPQTWGTLEPTISIPFDAGVPDQLARQVVLRHEMAHIVRFDALRLTAERLMAALYWWNPLAWLAGKHAHLDREQACDDIVLLRSAQPSAYANQLLLQACGIQYRQAEPEGASLLSAVDGPLVRRIGRILDPHARRQRPSTFMLAPLILAIVLVSSGVSAIGVTVESKEAFSASDNLAENVEISVDGDTTTIEIHNTAGKLTATIHGEVRFSADHEIERISPGGSFTVLDERVKPRQVIAFKQGDSEVFTTYLTDDGAQPLDRVGHAWLDAALLELFRLAGVAAPQRVNRILRASGATGILAEVEQIPSDYVRATYLNLAMRHHEMDDDGRALLLASLGKTVEKESERTQLIISLESGRLIATLAVRSATLEAVATLNDSPADQRRALEHVVPAAANDEEYLVKTLELSAGMQSDAELGGFLAVAAPFVPGEGGAALDAWIAASESIQIDAERGQAIRAMLRRSDTTGDLTIPLIESAAGIERDTEKAQLLIDVVSHYRGSKEERSAYQATAATIGTESSVNEPWTRSRFGNIRSLTACYTSVVVLTMLGRIDLGKHWPIDAVAGVLAGLIAVRLPTMLHDWVENRSHERNPSPAGG
ncbi:MAG: M56 family metallopeptidase [Thermomicrobiales bacterium]